MKRKKFPKNVLEVFVDVYGIPVYFCFSKKDHKKFCDFIGVENSNTFGYSGFADEYENSISGATIISVNVFDGNIGTYNHEVMHAVFKIMDIVGIHYTPESGNEAFAYLMSFLTEKSFDAFKKSVDNAKKEEHKEPSSEGAKN